jgi:2-oxoisovalerate dehydrogenase E1 component
LTGHIPVFELQFIDFVGPAFNQIVNQIATLRWRTKGRYSCPMVILAPCGAYIGCGGPWHSQTNEAWFAHAPGLKIAMPSTPRDAAEIIAAAAYGQDPVLVLLPKNLFFKTHLKTEMVSLYPEQARIRRSGKDITILAWGNTVDISLAAASAAEQQSFDVEVIDLCSIVPCDWATIFSSLRKTGRLLVVQEDNRSCSFGQALISESVSKPEIWKSLKAPPELISRADVHVGFHSDLEKAVLPWKEDVLKKIIALMEYE